MMADDIIFYTKKGDWKEECRACLYKDFKEDTMIKLDADYDTINKIFHTQDINNWRINRVDVKYKNESTSIFHNIKWVDFDPRKMNTIVINTAFNIMNIIKSGKAPGLVERTSRDRGSIMHRGKVDEGAVEDLLDKSLPKAQNRVNERQTKMGHAFTKNDSNKTILRRK